MTCEEFDKEYDVVSRLMSDGLIEIPSSCSCCGGELSFVVERSQIHFRFNCGTCGSSVSIRDGTIFSGSRLKISQIIDLCRAWWKKRSLMEAADVGHTSVQSACSWFSNCRLMCSNWVELEAPQLGGPNKVVEIDEAAFGRRKYKLGRLKETVWVLGGVERSSRKVFLEIVRDRTARTIIPIIQKWVAPGTTIMTDEFGAYRRLGRLGYKHKTVCHKYNFVNPRTGAHTQTIEGLWQHVRALLPLHGMRPTNLHMYLDEFVYRRYNANKGDGVLADLVSFRLGDDSDMWD